MAVEAGGSYVVSEAAPGTSAVQYDDMGTGGGAVPAVIKYYQTTHEERVETVRRFLMEEGIPESLLAGG